MTTCSTPQEVLILATPDPLAAICAIPPTKRTAAQAAKLRSFFLETSGAGRRSATRWPRCGRSTNEIERFSRSFPTVMVMEEMNPPRETHVLIRGQYDHPGETVSPGTPACLPPLRGRSARTTAWDLPGGWSIRPIPLTARVAVNRQWQMFFGQGLVRTTEDFGSQGDRPSHPELLDWLATEFIRRGWDVKSLDRLIVTSATYRQSSNATRQAARTRSGKPAAGPRAAETPVGRDDPRPGPGRQRAARRADRRPVGRPVPAGGTVGRL